MHYNASIPQLVNSKWLVRSRDKLLGSFETWLISAFPFLFFAISSHALGMQRWNLLDWEVTEITLEYELFRILSLKTGDYFVFRLKYITKRRGTVKSDGEMQIWTFLSVVSEIMNCLERMSRCASCRNNKHHFQNNKQNRTPHNRNNYYFHLLLLTANVFWWVTLHGNTETFTRVSPIKAFKLNGLDNWWPCSL